jgi:hypothetical protein
MARAPRSIERKYSPAEVAAITGASTSLQRDWRRRGILRCSNEPGWSSFDLHDVVEIFIFKWFSDAGFFVKQKIETIRFAAANASLSILNNLKESDRAAEFSSDYSKGRMYARIFSLSTFEHSTIIRFLVILHSNRGEEDDFEDVVFTDDLNSFDEKMQELGSCGFTALDLFKIADLIAERGGLPFIRVGVDE